MMIKSILLTACGFLLLGLGAVGIFIPILPTTPFVLAATACFTANPKLRRRIVKVKFIEEHLTNYQNGTGLRRPTLIVSLSFLWLTLIISMVASGKPPIVALLTAVGIAVTIHLVCISRPRQKKRKVSS